MNTTTLRFGAIAIPEGVEPETAWGARMIVTQDGYVDFLADRQDAVGPVAQAFCHEMNEAGIVTQVRETIGSLLRSGDMDTRVARNIEILRNDWIVVHATTNASAGYCYVAAWPISDGVAP